MLLFYHHYTFCYHLLLCSASFAFVFTFTIQDPWEPGSLATPWLGVQGWTKCSWRVEGEPFGAESVVPWSRESITDSNDSATTRPLPRPLFCTVVKQLIIKIYLSIICFSQIIIIIIPLFLFLQGGVRLVFVESSFGGFSCNESYIYIN